MNDDGSASIFFVVFMAFILLIVIILVAWWVITKPTPTAILAQVVPPVSSNPTAPSVTPSVPITDIVSVPSTPDEDQSDSISNSTNTTLSETTRHGVSSNSTNTTLSETTRHGASSETTRHGASSETTSSNNTQKDSVTDSFNMTRERPRKRYTSNVFSSAIQYGKHKSSTSDTVSDTVNDTYSDTVSDTHIYQSQPVASSVDNWCSKSRTESSMMSTYNKKGKKLTSKALNIETVSAALIHDNDIYVLANDVVTKIGNTNSSGFKVTNTEAASMTRLFVSDKGLLCTSNGSSTYTIRGKQSVVNKQCKFLYTDNTNTGVLLDGTLSVRGKKVDTMKMGKKQTRIYLHSNTPVKLFDRNSVLFITENNQLICLCIDDGIGEIVANNVSSFDIMDEYIAYVSNTQVVIAPFDTQKINTQRDNVIITAHSNPSCVVFMEGKVVIFSD